MPCLQDRGTHVHESVQCVLHPQVGNGHRTSGIYTVRRGQMKLMNLSDGITSDLGNFLRFYICAPLCLPLSSCFIQTVQVFEDAIYMYSVAISVAGSKMHGGLK